MNTLLEKTLTYLVGGIIGAIVGYLLMKFEAPVLSSPEACMATVITTVLLGVMAAVIYLEYTEGKVLRKNNIIRDETVALITHEMRTGLTSTGWAIEMMLKKYADKIEPSDKELLEGVIKSIKTTVMHSVNLLDISLLDIGKLSISLERVDLKKVDDLFRETMEKYSLGAARKQITLTSNIKLDHAQNVEVDMLRLRIILENLLENAIQYIDSASEKKSITVDITNEDTNMLISVSDTGIGIPASEQNKIFSEFFRASNARKKLSSGSGIGLFTCAQYIKAHRGTIRFESKENVGTTFFVTIPLKTVADVNEFLTKI